MPTLEEIRKYILLADNNKLSEEQIYTLLESIMDYKDIYRHLPQDIQQWYDETMTFIEQYNNALGGDWEGLLI